MTQGSDQDNLELCPDELVLSACARGKVSSGRLMVMVSSHLAFCPSCNEKFQQIKRMSSKSETNPEGFINTLRKRQEDLRRGTEAGPIPGTLWRAAPESSKVAYGPLLLVLHTEGRGSKSKVWVAEVSEDIPQAIETDYILEQRESGLGFRCMVRTGNVFQTNGTSLTAFAGKLSPDFTKKITEFVDVAATFDTNVPLSKYQFYRDSQGNQLMSRNGITSGMLVTRDNDPRLGFLTRSRDRCKYLHVVRESDEKPKIGLLDTNKLIGLLQGLVSELSMWGSLVGPTPQLAYSGATGEADRLARRSSLEPSPKPVEIEIPKEEAGPTREEVLKQAPEKREFKQRDTIHLSITVPEDGYLVVVHYCQRTGDLEIVFPKPDDKSTKVSRKQSITIYRTLKCRPGRYEFIAIFSNKEPPFRGESLGKGKRMQEALLALIEQIQTLDQLEWRAVSYEYDVLRKRRSPWFWIKWLIALIVFVPFGLLVLKVLSIFFLGYDIFVPGDH